jgi:hypothetical protein
MYQKEAVLLRGIIMGHLPTEPERQKSESKKYPCVFELTDDCPVKKEFKLKPENLRPWCEICPIRHQEIKEIEVEVVEESDQDTEYETSKERKEEE